MEEYEKAYQEFNRQWRLITHLIETLKAVVETDTADSSTKYDVMAKLLEMHTEGNEEIIGVMNYIDASLVIGDDLPTVKRMNSLAYKEE